MRVDIAQLLSLHCLSSGAAAIGAAAVYIYKSGETPEEVLEVSLLKKCIFTQLLPHMTESFSNWQTILCQGQSRLQQL